MGAITGAPGEDGAPPKASADATAIVVANKPGALSPLVARADAYAAQARSPNTRRAYAGDWRRFTSWCDAQTPPVAPLPPDPKVRRAYVASLADRGHPLTTIRRALTSIAVMSREAGHVYPQADPELTDTLHGIAREHGDRPHKKRALLVDMLATVLNGLRGEGLMATRNRCLLSLGWFFAGRRSELAGVDIEHVRPTDEPREPGKVGLVIFVPRSKTDPRGRGREVGIPYARHADVCPVRLTEALIAALQERGVTSGPLLMHVDRVGRLVPGRMDGGSIARILKRVLKLQGFDERNFAGHSLRRGFVSSAVRARRTWDSIRRTTGHSAKSVRMMLEYSEEAAVLDGEQNAGSGLL